MLSNLTINLLKLIESKLDSIRIDTYRGAYR